jgi:tRNA(fMet)-specific endonuclease VapC
MNLLDSDHLSALQHPGSPSAVRLKSRLAAAADAPATTIVTVEEAMRGWLAAITKERQPRRQVAAYRELAELFGLFAGFRIVPFDDRAADEFTRLRAMKVRIGTPDLKIAAIARVHDAVLVTRNRRDFEQVPGLRLANWLDP